MGWVSHLDYFWREPSFARFLRRLASFSRLILFDKRGTGLSDRVAELPTLEQRMDDVRAVMDAVGSRARGAAGRLRGRADVQPLRRHLPGADARAGDDRHLRASGAGRPTTRGRRPRASASASSRRSSAAGAGRSGIEARAPSRRARPGVPRLVEHLPAHGRQPGRGAGAHADERRDRRPRTCCRRSACRRWSCTAPTTGL